jgi:hypothetical protein
MQMAVIKPAVDKHGEPSAHTMGTHVEIAPGVYLHHVTRIELLARVDSLWQATIQCDVRLQPIKATLRLRLPRPGRYYRRGGRAIWK